jgi:acyl-CoA thioesterase-2
MSPELQKFLDYLEVKDLGPNQFVASSPGYPKRVFGGQVLAQSLSAASKTLSSEMVPHSQHAYFLRAGDHAQEILYEVDPIRDGRSFATRRVVASQGGKAIFNTSISFQIPEQGLEHQQQPEVEPPEKLIAEEDYFAQLPLEHADKYRMPIKIESPFARILAVPRDVSDPQPTDPQQYFWLRPKYKMRISPLERQMILVYLSDIGMLGTALLPHPYTFFSKDIQEASLDNAIWFHRPFDLDNDLLYVLDSPSSSAGRGFIRGSLYTHQGELIASTAQEALIRRHSK